jgi:aryl-alcohol dehydrogenase-like predicted oxidoreductase
MRIMEYRKLGSLNVSLIGIGCNNFGWRIDAAGTAAVVDAALDTGINFFDTADVYGAGQSEEFLGKALKGRRNKAIIATKFGMKMGEGKEGARPQYIRQALDASLQRLQVETIDLYQIHRADANTPIADTMQALNDAVKAGKVREIGCSNFSADQMRDARATPGPRYFSSVQNDYSMIHREPEAEVLPECARSGVAFLPYFPLANGLLTGKYRKGKPFPDSSRGKDAFGPKIFTPANLERAEALISFSESHGHSLLDLAFSWLAARPEICCVIAGAKTPDQVRSNSRAASWKLTAAELAEVDRILA